MIWLFGIGSAFEIAGALLLVVPTFRNPWWSRGMLILQDEPTREELREVAYGMLGVLLIAFGFSVQLVGFVARAETWWLFLLVVVATLVTVFFGGALFAERVALPWIRLAAIREHKKRET